MDKFVFSATRIFPICDFGKADNYIFSAGMGLSVKLISLSEMETFALAYNSPFSIPSHIFERKDFHEIVQWMMQHREFNVSIQISSPSELQIHFDHVQLLWEVGIAVDIFFQSAADLVHAQDLLKIHNINIPEAKGRWVYLVNKLYKIEEYIAAMSKVEKELYLSFLPNEDLRGIYLTPKEIPLELEYIKNSPHFEGQIVHVLILEEFGLGNAGNRRSNKVLRSLSLSPQKDRFHLPHDIQGRAFSLFQNLRKYHLSFILYIFRDVLRFILSPWTYLKQKGNALMSLWYKFYTLKYKISYVFQFLKYKTLHVLHLIRYKSIDGFYIIRHRLIHGLYSVRHKIIRGIHFIRYKIVHNISLICYQTFHWFRAEIFRLNCRIKSFAWILRDKILLLWHYRYRFFFPFYKVYWIVENRFLKGKTPDE